MPLILLANPELSVHIPVLATTKDLTHWRMCAFKAEAPRPHHLIAGYLDIWFAKCFIDGESAIEAPGIPGPFDGGRYRVEDDTLVALQGRLTTGGLPSFYEMQMSIFLTLLEIGALDGTIVPEVWELPQ